MKHSLPKSLRTEIYELDFGEYITFSDIGNTSCYTRVPGGWIRDLYSSNRLTSIFIPFNNEYELLPRKHRDGE